MIDPSSPSVHAALVEGTRPGISLEVAELLRSRLKLGTVILCVVALLFTVHGAFFEVEGRAPLLGAAIFVVYAALSVLLWSRRPLSLRQLRIVELVVFGLLALNFLANQYSDVLQWANRNLETLQASRPGGGGAEVLMIVHSMRQAAFVIMAVYALFVPNTWKRALVVLTCIGSLPFVIRVAIAVLEPEIYAVVRPHIGAQEVTFALIWMVAGVAITTAGTHVIQTLREEAFEAKQLGQYQLTETLGAGGMGEVWKAEHRLLARPAAIKLVRAERVDAKDLEAAQGILRRFEREAQATALLRSVHTIEIYDFGISEEGAFYYVMELLDGFDLENLVKEHGPVPAARVIYLLRQACDSLAEAHQHGLIHRDIKPANLFACRMGMAHDFIKVLDFGLVKADPRREDAETALTVEGMTAGTPAYMSPEQVLAKGDVSERTDIYSLGCVAYWLLTGCQLFESSSPMEVAIKQVNEQPVPPSQRTELEVPADLERIIMACLAKNPGERPAGAVEVAEMLAACEQAGAWSEARAREWWELHMGPVDTQPHLKRPASHPPSPS